MIWTSGSRVAHGPATSDLRMAAYIMLMEVEAVIAYVLQAFHAASCSCMFHPYFDHLFLTSSTTINTVFNGSKVSQGS